MCETDVKSPVYSILRWQFESQYLLNIGVPGSKSSLGPQPQLRKSLSRLFASYLFSCTLFEISLPFMGVLPFSGSWLFLVEALPILEFFAFWSFNFSARPLDQ